MAQIISRFLKMKKEKREKGAEPEDKDGTELKKEASEC